MSEWIKKLSEKNTHKTVIQQDDNGEYFIELQEDMLNKAGISINDRVAITKVGDRSLQIKKIETEK